MSSKRVNTFIDVFVVAPPDFNRFISRSRCKYTWKDQLYKTANTIAVIRKNISAFEQFFADREDLVVAFGVAPDSYAPIIRGRGKRSIVRLNQTVDPVAVSFKSVETFVVAFAVALPNFNGTIPRA